MEKKNDFINICILIVVKSKITKILNSNENSKWEVPNQMAKSKAQKHQNVTVLTANLQYKR